MSLHFDDTIAALASAPGAAAEGIIRIGGPGVKSALASSFVPDDRATYDAVVVPFCHPGKFRCDDLRVPIPIRLYLWPGNKSYTGAPMAEIHAPGSPPLLEAILSQLHRNGARPARPGEFTLRAFLAGRIDLTQAEAVLGVIDANDHHELTLALDQLAGGLSGPIGKIREDLLLLLADLEAELDFVEEDLEFVPRSQVIERLAAALEYLESLQTQSLERMRSTGRLRVVLAGLPNAGKSTLFNALVGRDAALVSEQQGTTRDYLSAELDWDGLGVELIDTAGWLDASTGIDHSAQLLRHEQFERADVVIWCTAANLETEEQQLDRELRRQLATRANMLHATTKCDCRCDVLPRDRIALSAQTGENIDALTKAVVESQRMTQTTTRHMLGTTASRSRDSLDGCVRALHAARAAAESGRGQEIIAIELRSAVDSLGAILGAVYTDDILDRIFSRFCIGK